MHRSFVVAVLFLSGILLVSGCKAPSIDWSAKENFFASEKSEKTNDGARLEFHSLVDVTAAEMYRALADAEHYASFIDGVTESSLVSGGQNTKVTQITQTVIGRQAHAQVRWTLHPDDMRIEFETVQSDANYNDGSYKIIASPDGIRCYIISIFDVKEKGAPPNVPIGVLQSATREGFAKAAHSIKLRTLRPES